MKTIYVSRTGNQMSEISSVSRQRTIFCRIAVLQGGPAKVKPPYIFDGNIWMRIGRIQ